MKMSVFGRIVTTFLLGFLMAGTASADYPLEGADVAALTELLKLDAYQVGEVKTILEAQRDRFRAAMNEHRQEEQAGKEDDHTILKQRIQEARAEARQKLALVLSAEQLAKYEGFVQGRERHR